MEEISLRNFFAAHAPSLPDWFRPILPERPKSPPNATTMTAEEEELMEKHYDYDKGDWIDGYPATSKLAKSAMLKFIAEQKVYAVYDNELEKYNRIDLKMLTLVQWRFKYADAMIEAGVKQ